MHVHSQWSKERGWSEPNRAYLKFSFWHTSKCSIGGHNRHQGETSCPGDTYILSTENGPKVFSKPPTLPVSRVQFNHPFLIIRTCTHIDPETNRMKRTKTGQSHLNISSVVTCTRFIPSWWYGYPFVMLKETKRMQRQGFAVTKVLSWYDLLYIFQIS